MQPFEKAGSDAGFFYGKCGFQANFVLISVDGWQFAGLDMQNKC
jgi:hypothetical protein